MYSKRGAASDLMVLSLDAERHLFEVFNRFNPGSKFISVIKLIVVFLLP